MSDASLPFLAAPHDAKADKTGLNRASAVKSTTGRYQYAPLEDHQIRVLGISVEPTTGFLVCNFHHRDLASSLGAYRAISYCWGDPTPTDRVLCSNGQSLHVTKSCAEILTHVIPRRRTEVFWIDQLCINQEDKVEKSAQVLLMGQIYSSTKQVIAWLGPGDKGSAKAVDFVETMFGEIEGMKRKGLQPSLEPLMSSAPRIRNLPSEMQRERKWSALSSLLRNAWFERVWVMQEVIMACAATSNTARTEDHTITSFENRTISFDVLAEVLKVLEKDNLNINLTYDRQNSDGTEEQGVDPPGINAIRLFSTFRDFRNRGISVLLNTALSRAWHFQATNARDKLYAVLGFCDDVADARLRPDYEADVEDIYRAWAAVLLERGDKYAFPLPMAGIGLQRSYTSLPSWVPDFSSSSYEVQIRSEATGGSRKEGYQASGANETTELVIDRLTWSIRLQGIQIDTIEAVFPQPSSKPKERWYKPLLLTPDKEKYRSLLQWLENVEAFLKTSPIPLSYGTQPKDILWQTMVGHYGIDQTAIDSDLSQAFECWYQSYRELAGKDKSRLIASQSRKPQFYDQVQTFEDLKASSLQDRPIFATNRKRLLGHGPKGLLPGDIVCVIKGALTPFLLREDTSSTEHGEIDQRWRLVGACFVHGVMYGEGLGMGEWREFLII